MVGRPDPICEVCERPDAIVVKRWRRLLPDVDFLGLCQECEVELAKKAGDRGSGPEDHSRIMQMGRLLYGEVWSNDAGTYWFREPVIVRVPDEAEEARSQRMAEEARAATAKLGGTTWAWGPGAGGPPTGAGSETQRGTSKGAKRKSAKGAKKKASKKRAAKKKGVKRPTKQGAKPAKKAAKKRTASAATKKSVKKRVAKKKAVKNAVKRPTKKVSKPAKKVVKKRTARATKKKVVKKRVAKKSVKGKAGKKRTR